MMPKTPRHIRVFLSSPGDVKEERDAADRILEELPRVQAWKDKFTIDPVRWDDPHAPAPMDAHLTPQEAVNRSLSKPSQCDVVVVILWGRMGTPLPESYKKLDGTLYLSGTEWEFEDAQMAGRRILLYRRTEKPRPDIDDPDYEKKRKQYQLVQEFFKRFEGADGSLTGGYTSYQTVVEFEKRFRQDIEGYLRQLDDEEPKGGGRDRAARVTAAPVTQAYRDWLKSECGGVELLGMRLRHGQAVRLNHIYVPVTIWSAEHPQLALGALEHDSLYLSGTPGSGKSTFCRWVAWLVSEGAMPAHEVDPPQEYAEQFPEALRGRLPVLVRLRDFWRFLPRLPIGSDLSGAELEQALVRWLASKQPQGLAAEELRAHLERGTTLLILDGVDEVSVSANGDRASWAPRSLLVSGLKHGCPDWTKKGNRILLTSRPYGLTTGDTPQGLSPMPIESLPDELQTLLVQRWFRVLADTEEAAQMTARDMQAHLAEHWWLEPLTANPLLLTAMCIIYDEGKRLPQDKHDLYDRIIDTVLHGRYRDDPVAKDAARNRLGVIAHGMHTGEGLGEARTTPQAEATYAEIERMLKIYQDRSPWTEKGYLGAVETREDLLSNSGLLLSSDEKRAQFYHLSFQEFLAAQRILDLAERSLLDVFSKRAAASEWRNTLSLLFGRVLGTHVSPEQGISLVRNIIEILSPKAIGLQLVAADCIETLLAKGIRLPKDQESRLQQIFLQAIRSDALARNRAHLGNKLARLLGDPRFHDDAWYLPDELLLGFVEIPEGPFLMGSKWDDLRMHKEELDQHPVTLPRYYIARYPVTVAQFQAFVQDRSDQPKDKDSLRGLSHHPVVNVSWHEARKYCEWLTERLREWKGTPESLAALLHQKGWQVTLPSEAEWEKAARGTEGRIYPWGNDPDPNRANYSDTGINYTTAVGCFAEGVTPYGCLDMAGNVWEWTRSLWGEYPYPTETKEHAQREDLSARGSRVLRGGAFYNGADDVRCASRNNGDPDLRFKFVGFRVGVSPFFSER